MAQGIDHMIAGNIRPAKPPRHAQTIAAGYGKALLDFAVTRGADRDRLLAESNIDARAIADPEARLALDKYAALMRTAKTLTKNPALALAFGEAFDTEQLSIVGLMGMASRSLGDAAAQLNRYMPLIADVDVDGSAGDMRFAFQQRGREAWLVDTRKNPNQFPELTESSFVRMVRMARQTQADLIKAVHFTHSPPAYRSHYDRAFGVPVSFDCPCNAIVMAVDWAGLTPARPSPYAMEIFAERANTLLEELDASDAGLLSKRLETMLEPLLGTPEGAIDAIAGRLNVTRQTLHRQLKAEGTTFVALRDALRFRLARRYLADDLPVTQIAYKLGFSDPAAFSRAFKRWSGRSPRDHGR